MKRRRQARPTPPAARPAAARPLTDRLALLALWLLVLVPPLVFDPMAKDSFRLPKEVLSETLALVSLTLLCLRLRRTGELGWRRLSRHPAVQATVPLLAAAALAAAASAHPLHAREGLASLAIGAAALALWSLALRPDERRRLLAATAIPATVLSVIVILQFHRLWEPFAFVGGARQRQGLTSFAGGAFDLAAYLVLPLLVAQLGVSGARSRRTRWAWGLALVVGLYAMALTQTLTALAALIAASLVLWSRRLSSRRPERRRLLAAVAVLALLGGAIGLAVKPLRQRVASKAELLAAGKLNTVLTGRLDGWRAARWMFAGHPWLGVGPGAFTTEFAAAKLDLSRRGAAFFQGHVDPHFASAHNEVLEVAAEQGALGLLAAAWGLFVLGRELARKSRRDAPEPDEVTLMLAGTAALVVLALATFPLHLAIVAYPYLLLLSGALAPGEPHPPARGPRRVALLAFVVLLGAVVWQLLAAGGSLRSSRLLAGVEKTTQQASRAGRLPPRLGEHHLRLLATAGRLDPARVDVSVARGWQYLLTGRPHGAVRAFEEALALEPRAEVYANLGQAHLAAGDRDAARDAFARAVELDPRKHDEIRKLFPQAAP
ncbi:MAG TPA: O-antigen ligase family protein [Thermoanaerobaculia bacterium]